MIKKDIVIVGSGPSGVSASIPLLENNFDILMVSAGEDIKFHTQNNYNIDGFLGNELSRLNFYKDLSPKINFI